MTPIVESLNLLRSRSYEVGVEFTVIGGFFSVLAYFSRDQIGQFLLLVVISLSAFAYGLFQLFYLRNRFDAMISGIAVTVPLTAYATTKMKVALGSLKNKPRTYWELELFSDTAVIRPFTSIILRPLQKFPDNWESMEKERTPVKLYKTKTGRPFLLTSCDGVILDYSVFFVSIA